jgi:isopenicillin N synthase-like dioxygenase
MTNIPVINIEALLAGSSARHEIAAQLGRACRDYGFFYVTGHGVSLALQQRLASASRQFFAQDTATKMQISMARGGRAWRGYFPLGDELTSGQPDQKEGLYFGAELAADHPLPLHGANLFPHGPTVLRAVVLEYLSTMTQLGHGLMRGIALSLGLDETYFAVHYTGDPLVLFRIFNYPAVSSTAGWGVGEHTDYGLLTILLQDDAGGLQVKVKGEWLEAPPIENTFVCNLGDMLDRLTGGLYRSTPHRVSNVSGRDRLSFPFFFDPNFNARIEPLPLSHLVQDDQAERWDRASVHAFQGTYGEYLLNKVGKVFPQLLSEVT